MNDKTRDRVKIIGMRLCYINAAISLAAAIVLASSYGFSLSMLVSDFGILFVVITMFEIPPYMLAVLYLVNVDKKQGEKDDKEGVL